MEPAESDIQVISDHFASGHSAENGGVPVEDRFRIYHGATQPAPNVNPASSYALQKAYEDLKTRYNEVTNKNTAYERQIRTLTNQLEEHSIMASNSPQRLSREGDSNTDLDLLEKQSSFHVRRQFVELAKEHKCSLEEITNLRKRVSDLENINQSLSQDNQSMTVRKGSGLSESLLRQNENLQEKLKLKELELEECKKRCEQLETQIRSGQQVSGEDSQAEDGGDNWARFVLLQLEMETRKAEKMKAIAQQNQQALIQLLSVLAKGNGISNLPSIMTRSAPGIIEAVDTENVSVEVPSNTEQFPVILQPRGTSARMQRSKTPVQPQRNNMQLPVLQEESTPLVNHSAGTKQTPRKDRQTSPTVPLAYNNLPGRYNNGTHQAQQCSDDLFFHNVKKHKDDIVHDIIEEQRRQPLLPNRNQYGYFREPVGTVFATSSSSSGNLYQGGDLYEGENYADDTPKLDVQPQAQGLQALEGLEEETSLRRDAPLNPTNDRTAFSMRSEEFQTTLEGSPLSPDRAMFTFELGESGAGNNENRHHPLAQNQQPRPLNIDRNYDDPQRMRSNDNTVSNRNINNSERHDTQTGASGRPRPQSNPPVLNNDPLWTPKTVPQLNLYSSHSAEREETRQPVQEQSQRICPICDLDFPSTMAQDEVQDHVNRCLNTSEETVNVVNRPQYSPRPAPIAGHGPASTGAMAAEQRSCPICSMQFADDLSITRINIHVNSHFENPVANFEILDPS